MLTEILLSRHDFPLYVSVLEHCLPQNYFSCHKNCTLFLRTCSSSLFPFPLRVSHEPTRQVGNVFLSRTSCHQHDQTLPDDVSPFLGGPHVQHPSRNRIQGTYIILPSLSLFPFPLFSSIFREMRLHPNTHFTFSPDGESFIFPTQFPSSLFLFQLHDSFSLRSELQNFQNNL